MNFVKFALSRWHKARFWYGLLTLAMLLLLVLTWDGLITILFMAGIYAIVMTFDYVLPWLLFEFLPRNNWKEYYESNYPILLSINSIKIRIRPPLIPLDGIFDEKLQ